MPPRTRPVPANKKPLTIKQIDAIASKKIPKKYWVSENLYLRISTSGGASWIYRYKQKHGKGRRPEITIGIYGDRRMSLREARMRAAELSQQTWEGTDPAAERKREKLTLLTVDDLAASWISDYRSKKLISEATLKVYERLYSAEISPKIGQMPIKKVGALDIREVLRGAEIRKEATHGPRPAVVNDTLIRCKAIFNHAVSLQLVDVNPAASLSNFQHGGGKEVSRRRALRPGEVRTVFQVLRENNTTFGRDNWLLCFLLLALGVRKTEMTEAPWEEFDLENLVWHLPAERSKNGYPIDIPIPVEIMPWIKELKVRSAGSDYLFPSRRMREGGKPFTSASTINNALNHMFGRPNGSGRRACEDKMAAAGITEHFTVHDLRRTFRTFLGELKVPTTVAERCLNHIQQGVEGIYDRSELLDLRREALTKLAHFIIPLIEEQPTN